jgi:hypothetical protein
MGPPCQGKARMPKGLQASSQGRLQARSQAGLQAVSLLSGLAIFGVAYAAPLRAPAPAAPPAVPEPGWMLGKGNDTFTLSYGMANGAGPIITFACVPRSGEIAIRLPEESGKAKIDENQSVSLTLGGVRSSFAGTVAPDPTSGGAMLSVTVTARNPMFTALAGPGGMRIEGKGFTKIVPLKAIGEKLRQFLGTCKRS